MADLQVLRDRLGGRDPTPQELAEVTGLDVEMCEELLAPPAEAPPVSRGRGKGKGKAAPKDKAEAPKPPRRGKAKAEAAKQPVECPEVGATEGEDAAAAETSRPKKRLRKADNPAFHAPIPDDRQREPHEMDTPQEPEVAETPQEPEVAETVEVPEQNTLPFEIPDESPEAAGAVSPEVEVEVKKPGQQALAFKAGATFFLILLWYTVIC